MFERLSARHQTWLENRRPDSSDSSTTSAFLSRFIDWKKSIAAQIESSADPSRLPHISAAISDLEKFVAENSYLLPYYEIRSSLKTISNLKQSRENLTSQLIPKKKFSFKTSKPTKTKTHIDTLIPQPDTDSVPVKTTSYPIRDSPGFRQTKPSLVIEFQGFRDR
ncbi:hypothetical protein Ddye_013693 [Dipteronia dyeriana]|uniref:Tubulin-specific chaperone C N-terminal domain-containing protein n=1 Tax=Dipteronia dyeriana TaxID=168575 RepID=A0AAD9X6W7_9ROSI|nr:hypothetical protein Ddye_013693 [Dipteronia dyeriana]